MADQISIANLALLSVGARAQISSFNPSDGSVEGDTISVLWQPTFEALGRAANWNCLSKTATLSLLQAAKGTPENPTGTALPLPANPWLYAYSHPNDCLLVRFIVPFLPIDATGTVPSTTTNNSTIAWIPSANQIPYAVSTSQDANGSPILVILTNQSQAQVVYNANIPNPAIWDSLFQAAMVASLGAFLVPALSLSYPLMDRNIKLAENAIARARAMDGNEGVTTMDHIPDWMAARAGGSGFGSIGNVSNWGGYVSVSWPSNYGY